MLLLFIFGGETFVEVGVDGVPLVSSCWPGLEAVRDGGACRGESFSWCLGLGSLSFAMTLIGGVVAHVVEVVLVSRGRNDRAAFLGRWSLLAWCAEAGLVLGVEVW